MHLKDNASISDGIIKWVSFNREERICERFPLDVWHQIVHDIDSNEEWADFVENYSNSVKCWVLKNKETNLSIAFIYIFNEDGKWKTVSIHGGGWGNPLLHIRGYILILKHLLEQDIKVRTYCRLTNATAIRFDKSVGFVPYRYTNDEVYMWINQNRFQNSRMYKYFKQERG